MTSYYQYWGKAKRDPEAEGPDYHLLAYHSLDASQGDVLNESYRYGSNLTLERFGMGYTPLSQLRVAN